MATVIDALLVTLNLDASSFTKGQKEALTAFKKTEAEATRTAKEMEARGKQAGGFFAAIKTEVLGMTAALLSVAGMTKFAVDVTNSDAKVGRFSKNVGLSTEEVTAWQGAAERAGGSAEGMAGSIKALSSAMQERLMTGTTKIIPFLTAAHVNLSAFFDPAAKATDQLLLLADAFKDMDRAKAQALGAGMGLDEGTINLLIEGREGVLKLIEAQKALNVTNEHDAELAIERQHAWQTLTDTMTGYGRTILNDVTPAVFGLFTVMQKLLGLDESGETFLETVQKIFKSIAPPPDDVNIQNKRLPGQSAYSTGEANQKGSTKASASAEPEKKTGGAPELFAALEKQYGLPAGLLDSMWKQESGRGKNMLSPAGAEGHFGFMPKTSKDYCLKDPNDLNESANAAARKMSKLMNMYNGSLAMALAAYNEGEGNLNKRGIAGSPMETQNYIPQVMGRMQNSGGNTSTSEIHVAQLNVNTQASDAPAIAKDIIPALRRAGAVAQANQGLT